MHTDPQNNDIHDAPVSVELEKLKGTKIIDEDAQENQKQKLIQKEEEEVHVNNEETVEGYVIRSEGSSDNGSDIYPAIRVENANNYSTSNNATDFARVKSTIQMINSDQKIVFHVEESKIDRPSEDTREPLEMISEINEKPNEKCQPDNFQLKDESMFETRKQGRFGTSEEITIRQSTNYSERRSRKSYVRGFSGRLSEYVNKFMCDPDRRNSEALKYFRVAPYDFSQLRTVQEPWPKGVKLYQPYEMEQILLPDNANCLAVQTFLKMCNLEYQVEYRANAEAMSPTGKVPFIKCGNFVISELEGIVQFVGGKGITLTEHLDAENKADMRAYMTLVNNVLGNAEQYICWCDNETYNEITKPRYSSVYPWPLNHLQCWTKRNEETKKLKIIGWYEKTLEEVFDDVEHCCQSLTDRLDDGPYFYGDKFSELDALVFAHIFTILTTSLPSRISASVMKFPKLVEFCKRVDSQIYHRKTNFSLKPYTKKSIRRIVLHSQSRSLKSPSCTPEVSNNES